MFASYDLVTEDVRGRPLTVFRDRPRNLGELLDRSLQWGDRDYIVDGDRRISYAEHRAAVTRVAGWLEEKGVGKGDRVAILGRNSIEWVLAFWATVSVGAIAVALNAWWSQAEIDWALDHAQPKLVVDDMIVISGVAGWPGSEPQRREQTVAGAASRFGPGARIPGPAGPIRGDVDEDDPAVILYTSGTTGRPKGATHSHRNVVCLTQAQQHLAHERIQAAVASGLIPEGFEVPPPRVLTSTPLFHVSGLHSGVVAMLAAGGTTIWVPGRFDPVTTMQAIERERATQWTSMPTTVWRLVHHPRRHDFDLSSLRHVGGGGAAWSPALQAAIRETFGDAVSWGIGYGLTEGTGLATTASYADLVEDPTTVGRPVATVEVKVEAGAAQEATSERPEGEICIRGPMVMLGYWRDPAATDAVIDGDGWLHSGDLGEFDQAGRLRLAARRSDLILRGAENVYPAEVESCLEGHPGVDEVAVVGLPDEEFGQIVAAIVVPAAGRGDGVDPDALTAWARERLGYFKVPARWFLRSEPLPRTATGKVIRNAVLQQIESAKETT